MTEQKEWKLFCTKSHFSAYLSCSPDIVTMYLSYLAWNRDLNSSPQIYFLHWLWCIERVVFVTKDRNFYLPWAYWKVSFIWRVVVILRKCYISIFSYWIKFLFMTSSIYSPLSLTTQKNIFLVLLPLPVLRHSPFLDICSEWKWMNGHISSSGHSGMHGNLAQCSSVLISQSHSWCIQASCWCNLPISFLAYLMIFSQVLVLPAQPFPKESFLFLCPKNFIIFCQITVFSNQPSRTSSSFLIEAFIPLWVHVTCKILLYHFHLNAVMYFASHYLIAHDSHHSVHGCWH